MRPSLFFRMTAPVIVVSLLLLCLGFITAWYVLKLQQNSVYVIAINVASVRAAEELEIGMREIRTQINQFLLTGDRRHLLKIPELRRNSDYWLAEATRFATTEQEQELMSQVERGYQDFFKRF